MAYKHGIYVSEVPSSVRAAVKSDAGIQAIIGTAPVNLLKDPYHAANIPMLFYTMAEAQHRFQGVHDLWLALGIV